MDTSIFKRTVNSMINQRLLDMHTGFIGKITTIDINKATVQPLTMYKVYGESAKTAAIITNVPILMPYKYVYIVEKSSNEVKEIRQKELKVGDTVYCAVCDRDITKSQNGNAATSSTGRHHSMSDSVIVMGLSEVEYVEGGD